MRPLEPCVTSSIHRNRCRLFVVVAESGSKAIRSCAPYRTSVAVTPRLRSRAAVHLALFAALVSTAPATLSGVICMNIFLAIARSGSKRTSHWIRMNGCSFLLLQYVSKVFYFNVTQPLSRSSAIADHVLKCRRQTM